jgi:hypothetical protein
MVAYYSCGFLVLVGFPRTLSGGASIFILSGLGSCFLATLLPFFEEVQPGKKALFLNEPNFGLKIKKSTPI